MSALKTITALAAKLDKIEDQRDDLLDVMEKSRRLLLGANPHCHQEYLFAVISDAFTVIDDAITKATSK